MNECPETDPRFSDVMHTTFAPMCVAGDPRTGTCGFFMPAALFDRRPLPDHPDKLFMHCKTCWPEVVEKEGELVKDILWHYVHEFGAGEDWPNFGCGCRLQPWSTPGRNSWEPRVCKIIMFDAGGNMTADFYFLAEQYPAVVHEVLSSLREFVDEAILTMKVEEFQGHIDTVVYNYPKWAPVPGIGHFPFDKHIKENPSFLTIAGWGRLFIEIAEKDMLHLGAVFVMGADMYDHPQDYALGRKAYREAEWFKKMAKRHLKLFKQDMDRRFELSPRRTGQLI